MNKWISVKDKLPEYECRVLFYINEEIHAGHLKKNNQDIYLVIVGSTFDENEIKIPIYEIIYWTTLPDLPEKE